MQVADKTRKSFGTEFPLAQVLAEAAVADSVSSLEAYWNESLEAERIGDITRALEIHEHILSEVGRSYVAYLRAGWLNYQAGGYTRSLEFYEKASKRSRGAVAPFFGAVSCYVAMGDTQNAIKLVKTIVDIDELKNVIPLHTASLHASNDFYAQPPIPCSKVERFHAQELLVEMGAA